MIKAFIKELELVPPRRSQVGRYQKLAENIHFHGANSRITVDGIDQSTNSVSEEKIFAQLRNTADSIADEEARKAVSSRIDALEATHGTGGFLSAYQAFIATAADHMTLLGPFIPALSKMLF